ncbi:hypothetical protein EVAR_73051_1, partial [Eumeta japonica]
STMQLSKICDAAPTPVQMFKTIIDKATESPIIMNLATVDNTAFKIVPKLWDFYMSEPQRIADRVQYKLKDGENDKWEMYHVDA